MSLCGNRLKRSSCSATTGLRHADCSLYVAYLAEVTTEYTGQDGVGDLGVWSLASVLGVRYSGFGVRGSDL